MKKDTDDFQRCFPIRGSAQVVCEYHNGSFIICQHEEIERESESWPIKKNRLELTR